MPENAAAQGSTTIEIGGVTYRLVVREDGCDLHVAAVGPQGLEERRVFGMNGAHPFGPPYSATSEAHR